MPLLPAGTVVKLGNGVQVTSAKRLSFVFCHAVPVPVSEVLRGLPRCDTTGTPAMSRLRHLFPALVALILLAAMANGQEPIRFARTPDISPDGKYVAFSYLGDIWVVESIGGVARPVTLHEAHDIYPVFSPDGRQIALASNRHGS